MESNFYIIEQKLNDFIRKFYSNRILQGVLLFAVSFGFSAFVVFLTEYFVYMPPIVKTILFYCLALVFCFIFVGFIVIPVLKLFRVFPVITFEESAKIISNYFSDSKDTFLNLLQLNKNCDSNADNDLLIAAVNQKISLISPLNFPLAINFKKTFKYLIIGIVILLFLSLLSAVNYTKISSGAERFLNFSTAYTPENPYTFTILNKNFELGRGEDYLVNVKIDGPTFPADVFINVGGVKLRMNIDSSGYYSYNFKNLNSDVDFNFNYLDYLTQNYKVSVFDKPQIVSFSVDVIPPTYTNISAQNFENTGDLIVPYGSNISWNFKILNGENFIFYIDSSLYKSLSIDNNVVQINKITKKSFNYSFSATGNKNIKTDSSLFHVKIVPDFYPSIECVSKIDSSASDALIFMGRITDDYGFSSLTFNYYYDNNPKQIYSFPVDFEKNAVSQDYFYYFDFSQLEFSDKISYYFEVKDNDKISGFKSSKTILQCYSKLSDIEKEHRLSDLHNSMTEKIEQTQRILNDLIKDVADFEKAMSGNKNISDWEKQLKLNNLVEKQNKLQNLLNQLSDENSQKNMFENQLNPYQNDELAQKQQQYQDLWNQLIDDDVKKLLDKINSLKDAYNDKNLKDKINDLKFDFNQISEQLDRNNQLLKMYNVENNVHKISDDLSKMADEYKNFSQEISDFNVNNKSKSTEDSQNQNKNNNKNSNFDNKDNNKIVESKNADDLSKKMNDFIDRFEKLMETYKKTIDENNELGDNKLDIEDINNDFPNIEKQLQNQKQQLDNFIENIKPNNNSNKSDRSNNSNNQDNNLDKNSTNNQYSDENFSNEHDKNSDLSRQMQQSSEDIQEMSDKLSGGVNMQQEQRTKENMNDVRQIQDNLLSVSFEQEKLLNFNKNILHGSSLQTESVKKQQNLKQDFDLIRDSIYALAKRTPELGHSVYEKISDIYHNFESSIDYMNRNNRSQAAIKQQSAMTQINDLSLLFNEILNQMQNPQNNLQSGGQQQKEMQSKNKKQSQQVREQKFRDMKNGQQSLKQMLQQMMEQLQKGESPSNQRLAESLKMQEMLQQQISEMLNNSNQNGKTRQMLNEINRLMEDTKRDIINKNITQQTLNRQQQIFNKLLESEKSDRQQEYDEKRESKSGNNHEQSNKIDLNSLKKLNNGTKEFLNVKYIDLDLFYINKYNNYLQNID